MCYSLSYPALDHSHQYHSLFHIQGKLFLLLLGNNLAKDKVIHSDIPVHCRCVPFPVNTKSVNLQFICVPKGFILLTFPIHRGELQSTNSCSLANTKKEERRERWKDEEKGWRKEGREEGRIKIKQRKSHFTGLLLKLIFFSSNFTRHINIVWDFFSFKFK